MKRDNDFLSWKIISVKDTKADCLTLTQAQTNTANVLRHSWGKAEGQTEGRRLHFAYNRKA